MSFPTCPVSGCKRHVQKIMCTRHWWKVSSGLRRAVLRGEIGIEAAVEELAIKEWNRERQRDVLPDVVSQLTNRHQSGSV